MAGDERHPVLVDTDEVSIDPEAGHFNDLGDGVYERVNEAGETIGFAILNVDDRKAHEIPFEAEFRRVSY